MANGWTTERRQRQAELIQQWQPWKHSTGAKTFEGKAISSQNAYKHGMSKLLKEMRILLKRQKQQLTEL
jgi:hypothetical protein